MGFISRSACRNVMINTNASGRLRLSTLSPYNKPNIFRRAALIRVCVHQNFSVLFLIVRGQRREYPRLFQPNVRVGKTGPRKVPRRAAPCIQFNYGVLALRPQPMPTMHTFCFCFRHVIGTYGTIVQEGAKRSLLGLQNRGGGYAPANLLTLRVQKFSRIAAAYPPIL